MYGDASRFIQNYVSSFKAAERRDTGYFAESGDIVSFSWLDFAIRLECIRNLNGFENVTDIAKNHLIDKCQNIGNRECLFEDETVIEQKPLLVIAGAYG